MDIKRTAVFAFIFVVFYNIFLFRTQPGIGTGVLFLSLNLFLFTVKLKDTKNLALAIGSSIISILFAFLFAFRSNIIVQTLNLGVASFFSLIALYFYRCAEKFSLETLTFLLLPFASVRNSVSGLLSILKPASWSEERIDREVAASLFKGIGIALPVFAVLLFLLAQADPVFEKFTKDILANSGERLVVSVIVLCLLMGIGLSKFLEKFIQHEKFKNPAAGKTHELSIIAGSILVLFTSFIAIQYRYLFSSAGERELTQLGIKSLTYSEYVRKGFFELLIASGIVAIVITYVFRYLHRLKNRQKLLMQSLCGILTLETGLLLLSAGKRLFLYADAHGLTRARVFGFVFLVWLLGLLAIFAFRVFRKLTKTRLFTSTLTITLIAFLALNVFNIDGGLATKYKPTVNGEIDYYYLTSLSTDGFESWKGAIEDSSKTISSLEPVKELSPEDNRKLYWANLTLAQLHSSVEYLDDKYKKGKNTPWQSYNLSEYLAFRTLEKDPTFFGQIPTLLDKAQTLNSRVSDDVRFNTPLDRSTSPPLTP